MDKESLWQSICGELGVALSSANFSAWIKPCFIKSVNNIDDSRILIEVETPSSFHVRTIEEKFYIHLREAADKVTRKKCEVAFVVGEKKIKIIEDNSKNTPSDDEPKLELFKSPTKDVDAGTSLSQKYTFESYMVGSSNRLAFAAGKSVVDYPGTRHNPLFIYGGVGVGKTHLMHAVGHELVKKGVGKVVCITSEQFTNDLVYSFRSKMTEAFKKKYRQVGALLIDDVQFFGGKDSTQEEFFHTFNELTSKSAQIIMTSDRKPQEIVGLEDRLKSRFLGGMMVDVGLPDYEMRLAILRQKAMESGATVEDSAFELMANSFETNGRELEGTFMRLMNAAEADKKPLSKEIVQHEMGLPANSVKSVKIRPVKVISTVAKYFDFKNKELLGTSRKADLVVARHIAMYILRDTLGIQQAKVGEIMGGRDHTTVIHAVEKIDAEIKANNVDLRRKVMAIKQALFT
jgi:chromosomal replication initiator protein